MSSGVKVNKSCLPAFDKVKMKKESAYVVFRLSDDLSEVIVDKISEKDAPFDELRAYLLETAEQRQCRYAVYDLHFDFKGQPKDKLVFISWSPENAVTKQKMLYTSSKDYLKKALQMVIELQATDAEELTLESLTERACRGMKD